MGENIKRVASGQVQGLSGKGQEGTSCRDDNALDVGMDLHHTGVHVSQNSWMVELTLALLYLGGKKNHK